MRNLGVAEYEVEEQAAILGLPIDVFQSFLHDQQQQLRCRHEAQIFQYFEASTRALLRGLFQAASS